VWVLNDEENTPPISQHPHTCVELHRVLINCHAVTSSTVVGWVARTEEIQFAELQLALARVCGCGYRTVVLAWPYSWCLPCRELTSCVAEQRGTTTRWLALSLNSTQHAPPYGQHVNAPAAHTHTHARSTLFQHAGSSSRFTMPHPPLAASNGFNNGSPQYRVSARYPEDVDRMNARFNRCHTNCNSTETRFIWFQYSNTSYPFMM
jgi:hypothetical protein